MPRSCSATLAAMLAGLFGLQLARADIYTWVDASGAVNISNLSPPKSVRITSVIKERPLELLAREDVARNAARQAELQVLSDRVRQLESKLESTAQPQASSQIIYVPVPAPTAAAVQYQANIPPLEAGGCDPFWAGCGGWWGSALYPTSVVFVGAPNAHRLRADRSWHHFPVRGHHGRSMGAATNPAGLQWPHRTSRAGPAKSGSRHLNSWTFPLGPARSTNLYDVSR